MVAAVVLSFGPTCPKARRFNQNFRPCLDKKSVVARRLPIIPHAEGHIGANVLLQLSRKDPYDLAIRSGHERLCYILAAIGRLPRKKSAPIPKPGSFGPRGRKRSNDT
jgi:hypothetical protein